MKKLAIIVLMGIYSLSTFGIGIRAFYCWGKLKSVNLSFIQDSKEKCGMKNTMSGCCKTKFKSFKVKDSHFAADGFSIPVKHFSCPCLFCVPFETNVLENPTMAIANASHAPPPHQGIPVYILNCVYRI